MPASAHPPTVPPADPAAGAADRAAPAFEAAAPTPAAGTAMAATGTADGPRPVPAAVAVGQAMDRLAGGLKALGGRVRARRSAPAPRRRPGGAGLRLLPAVIFCAVLMLGVRVGDLWQQLTVVQALDPGRQSLAQDETPAAQVTEPPAEDGAETTDADTPPAETAETEVADAADAAPAGGLAELDPSTLDETQLALLQDLAARRDALDARARDLDERAAMVAVAEQRLDEKVAELEALRSEIEGLMGRLDAESEARIANLASIYEAMRPGDAAAIFDGLEMDVIVAVLDRMRQTKSAPILAGMDPVRAREVTAELASRRDRAADAAASLSQ